MGSRRSTGNLKACKTCTLNAQNSLIDDLDVRAERAADLEEGEIDE
jgi:hypothetical protein